MISPSQTEKLSPAPLKRGEQNAAARKLREAEALRENLKRRKAQMRERAPAKPAQE